MQGAIAGCNEAQRFDFVGLRFAQPNLVSSDHRRARTWQNLGWPPYFNSVFIPLTAPLAAIVGVGSLMRWRQDSGKRLIGLFKAPLLLSIAGGVLLALIPDTFSWAALIALTLAVWTAATAIFGVYLRIQNKPEKWLALRQISLSTWAMTLAHFGIAVFIVGIGLTSIYTQEKDTRLAPGETLTLGGYDFTFHGVKLIAGVNYDGTEGHISISQSGQAIARFGIKMTLAALKRKVSDLPLDVTLDDSMSMMPGLSISSFDRLTITARISQTGNATPQSGELIGTVDLDKTKHLEATVSINDKIP